jgi:hypothetical protein
MMFVLLYTTLFFLYTTLLELAITTGSKLLPVCRTGSNKTLSLPVHAPTTVAKFPERLDRETRIVERGTLLEKGFSTVGTKLIHISGTGTHVPRTWNVAPYHVPDDYGSNPAMTLMTPNSYYYNTADNYNANVVVRATVQAFPSKCPISGPAQ